MSHQQEDDVRRVSWPQHHHHHQQQQQLHNQHQQQHLPFVQVPGDLHSTLPLTTPHAHQLGQMTPQTTAVYGMPQQTSPQQPSSPPNICYSSGHAETYSVLPVGHGNFLKVYHSADSEQPQIIYNNYELFASNTITQPTSQQHTANVRTAAVLNEDTHVMDGMHTIPMHPPGFGSTESPSTTTNMIINKLVNNWSPNLTGTYTQFGEQNATAPPIKTFVAANNAVLIQENHYTSPVDDAIQGISPSGSPSPVNQPDPKQVPLVNLANTNGSFESSSTVNSNPVQEVRKRIIAEVKPMRMSYSDVLSKINSQAVVGTPNGGTNIPNNQGSDTAAQITKSPKPGAGLNDKVRANAFPTERKVSPSDERDRIDSRGGGNRKSTDVLNAQQSPMSASAQPPVNVSQPRGEKKRSPTHENKENIQNLSSFQGKGIKKNPTKTPKGTGKQPPSTGSGAEFSKKRSSKRDDEPNFNTSKSTSASAKTLNTDKDSFYNIAKTDNSYERHQKYASQHNSTNSRKSRQSNGISFGSKASSSRFDKQQQLYTSNRRGQNRGAQNKCSTNKYELMKKVFDKWLLEYTIKILTWLFYLIYDIVVLGFSMVYERLTFYYASGYAYFQILRKDLKNNSNKPSIWVKNYLKRIDSKFKKNSKWAFWRRFYKKKPAESSTEFQKSGRLPQTGEEAMYSLLNCKGKDAYSILGVPANSSQEQIRKHYKKIAVLVHPDKNKQPGAEEAFKVLQRAFELIGEPENRAAYDQSLVEALHAEKAWTELHDLLSQLQTKIAEAANTIRCSSCGLRHPRKMTDRPHYAARECGSCKIRHSAREGDIWAETSWLRLRWKYLALMEGKVYDITEWANCQKGALSHLEPNSHMVQYRIVRGGQQQQQQQNQQQQQQQQQQREPPSSEATLNDFLDNLYSGHNPHGTAQSSGRRRPRRN